MLLRHHQQLQPCAAASPAAALGASSSSLSSRRLSHMRASTSSAASPSQAASPSAPSSQPQQQQELPATYRRLIARRTGGSFREVAEVDAAAPLPAPGPGQVLVRLHAAGVNGGCETFRARGEHAFARNRAVAAGEGERESFFTLGAEGAGVIAAVGPGVRVKGLDVGARVACNGAGAFAEYALVQAASCTPISDACSMAEAAALTLSAVTAAAALEVTADVKPNEVVVVTAAAGGAGHFAVQLAALRGARVVAVTSTQAKAARLRGELGWAVERVVSYAEGDDKDLAAVLDAEYPNGVDVVFEGVGGALRRAVAPRLAPGGRLLQVGYISQYPHAAAAASAPAPASGSGSGSSGGSGDEAAAAPSSEELLVEQGVPIDELFWQGRELQLDGGRRVIGQVWPRDPAAVRRCRRRVFKLHEEGKLRAWVDTSHGFRGVEQVADAVEYMLRGGHCGKVVVPLLV